MVLTPGEIAALIVSLVALGPTANDSARTAMSKLTQALVPPRWSTQPSSWADHSSVLSHVQLSQ